jgi:hypothetical protein
MDVAKDNLQYILGDTDITSGVTIHDIEKKLVKTLYCLYMKNVYYLDLKAANVLYKVNGDGSYKILLGDLGGLCGGITGDNMGMSTFNYKNNKMLDCRDDNDKQIEKTIIYGILIIIVQLMWQKLKTLISEEHKKAENLDETDNTNLTLALDKIESYKKTQGLMTNFLDNCFHIDGGLCTLESLQEFLEMEGLITEGQKARYSKMFSGEYTFSELIAEYV